MNLNAGTVVDDRYEILGAIGAGGFGTVYRARQLQLDRIVAIKVINLGIAQESDSLARFEREAKAISAIKHRNVVSIYGYGVWQDAPYMVLELLEGISLSVQLTNGQNLSVPRSISIVKQICQGLSSAHAHGIIHRDLKTSNVLTVRDEALETVKIIDFGLVKIIAGSGIEFQRLTEAGLAVGSCHYMSPEQCTASPVDHRSDIYAAGCILFHCLTGRLPFEGDNGVAVMFQHLNSPPKTVASISKHLADLPELQRVLDKALAKNPDERYNSALDMERDLDTIEISPHHLKSSHKLTEVKSTTGASPKRISILATGLAALALLALAASFFVYSNHAKTAPADFKSSNDLFVSVVDYDDFNPIQQGEIARQALKQNEKDHLLNAAQIFDAHLIAAAADVCEKKYEAALQHVDAARPLAQESVKYHRNTAAWSIPLRTGEALWGLGKKDEAVAIVTDAYNQQVAAPDSFGRERICYQLVSYLDANNQFDKVYPIYAAEINREVAHPLQQATVLRRLGDVFCLHNKLAEAETCYKRIGQLPGRATPALAMIRLEIAKGDWPMAHRYWENFMHSGQQDTPSTKLISAAFYLRDNKPERAKIAIKEALALQQLKSDWEELMTPWDAEIVATSLDSHGLRSDADLLRKILASPQHAGPP